MLSLFECERESKQLFFKLNNSLQLLSPRSSSTYKIAGIYAIYKGDVCHYVGQSKNLPSRLATHLCGKYKDADLVKLFFAGEYCGHTDSECPFYEWSKHDQTEALEANEALCISLFEPIENIYIPDKVEGDQYWLIDPSSESARIDIDESDFSVYRDPYSIMRSSSLLQEVFTYETESIRSAINAKS